MSGDKPKRDADYYPRVPINPTYILMGVPKDTPGAPSPHEVPGEYVAPDGLPYAPGDGSPSWAVRQSATREGTERERYIHNLGVYMDGIESVSNYLRTMRSVPDELRHRFHDAILRGSGSNLELESATHLTNFDSHMRQALTALRDLGKAVRGAQRRAQDI